MQFAVLTHGSSSCRLKPADARKLKNHRALVGPKFGTSLILAQELLKAIIASSPLCSWISSRSQPNTALDGGGLVIRGLHLQEGTTLRDLVEVHGSIRADQFRECAKVLPQPGQRQGVRGKTLDAEQIGDQVGILV